MKVADFQWKNADACRTQEVCHVIYVFFGSSSSKVKQCQVSSLYGVWQILEMEGIFASHPSPPYRKLPRKISSWISLKFAYRKYMHWFYYVKIQIWYFYYNCMKLSVLKVVFFSISYSFYCVKIVFLSSSWMRKLQWCYKCLAALAATLWFWTRDLWIIKPVP